MKETKKEGMERFPDYRSAQKHYDRQRFKDLKNVYALIHCRLEWLDACRDFLYGKGEN